MSDPRYWTSLADLAREAPAEGGFDEFRELLPLGLSAPAGADNGLGRRDFLKTMGLSSVAVMSACRRAPVQAVVPLRSTPDDSVPGQALYYATVCGGCAAGCGALAKTRDGRPIKLEGNPDHGWSQGGLCATGQASVLSLYDAARAHGPESPGGKTTWSALDREVTATLGRLAAAGRAIRVVAPPSLGPTGEAAITRLLAAFPGAARVRHAPLGEDAIAEAHRLTHGLAVVPLYHFDRARVIVSVNADFLGTWLSPVAFTRQYTATRDPARGAMSRHFQLEPHLSVTGSNADHRFPIAPSEIVAVLQALAARLGADVPAPAAAPPGDLAPARLDRLVAELRGAGSAGLVVTGSDDVIAQALAAACNHALGAYGSTVTLGDGELLADGRPLASLLDELGRGEVGAVLFLGTNPVYDHPRGAELAAALKRVDLTLSTGDRRDETGRAVQHLAPDSHALESWGDSEPARGLLGLRQPAVQALFDTRPLVESLLTWAGQPRSGYDAVRARIEAEVQPRLPAGGPGFGALFTAAVRSGVIAYPAAPLEPQPFQAAALRDAVAAPKPAARAELELATYAPIGLRDGRLGNNAWLQELPDPLAKTTWGNAAALAPETAARLGVGDGDVMTIAAGTQRLDLPVVVQPGLHPRAVAIALGYGRRAAGAIGDGVGANAFALAGAGSLVGAALTVARSGRKAALARTQSHFSAEGRPLVHEATLDEFARHEGHVVPEEEPGPAATMWPLYDYPGHRWGMAIDLNACTGCNACLVSCQAENNVAVVGADEVRRGREMHWLRIDRYYSGAPAEPAVVHQPMLCQHCDNAPCETVCPVLATVHSSEGLNQQVYNRCVGTRYCANNCPTKVRRFNWFDYDHGEPVERLVLNPDVVVRSRGVMEKCSFCVQRINVAKADAGRDGRPLGDGEVRTACQQSCPAQAIAFGDLNDPKSRVAELARSGRAYRVLDITNIQPAVRYLARIRNPGSST